jgi:propanol-preferring alcohol dehydrogenase
MRAMVFEAARRPLVLRELPTPSPGPEQVLVKVDACGVCRTDLHVIDGDLANPKQTLIPGHEIVGRVAATGKGAGHFPEGQRVGIPWLGTCGFCEYCRSGRENLCDRARFTGYTIGGGYAECAVADARYCFPLPGDLGDVASAPLLGAGLIGFRTLRKAGDARVIGFYGFGAAAHIAIQVARFEKRAVFGFTRSGDTKAQEFARRFGAAWAGGSDELPPELLDAALIFASSLTLVST